MLYKYPEPEISVRYSEATTGQRLNCVMDASLAAALVPRTTSPWDTPESGGTTAVAALTPARSTSVGNTSTSSTKAEECVPCKRG